MDHLTDPTDVFTPARRLRPFEDVATQIAERIQSGAIRSGERLPPERELCESFGVSRPTLREALRSLEALGIVEIRAGAHGGAFAVVPSPSHIADAVSTLVNLKGATSQHLDELRASFEPENAWWAAARRDEDDLRHLNKLVAAAEQAGSPADSTTVVGDIDAKWHEAVAAATKNPLRIGISRGIHNAVTRQVRALRVIPDEHWATIPLDLRRITEAIAASDQTAARDLMQGHVDYWSTQRTDHAIDSDVDRVDGD